MDATTFFLTYPQSEFDFPALWAFLETIAEPAFGRIAKEAHEDGSPHMHVVIKYKTRVRSRNCRLFDYEGRHPNIQPCRSIPKALEYVSKDGNFEDYGPVPREKKSFSAEELYMLATKNRTDFNKYCLEHRVSLQWADRVWQETHRTGDILAPGEGTEHMFMSLILLDSKTHIVIGPSGIGKSTWAKRVSPKPALWVTHIDDLKKLRSDHKAIIFDDMDFTHWPRVSQIHIVDQDDDRTINVKHGTATIPKHMVKIFTGNSYMFTRDPAIDRRIHITDLSLLQV